MNLLPARMLISIAGVFCLASLTACGGGSSGPASPVPGSGGSVGGPTTNPPGRWEPPRPAPEFRVNGEVFSFETGMIGNADVNLWVQTDNLGYSYWWWANDPLRTDALGLFNALVPNSEIFVLAFQDGFVQPCAVHGEVTEDREIDVEMISTSSLNSLNPPRPQWSHEPSVTGFVFENTANGRQPVAGAYFWAESPMEIPYATTFSDLGGGFYLCNLPQDTQIVVIKDGYKNFRSGALDTSQSIELSIELEHE